MSRVRLSFTVLLSGLLFISVSAYSQDARQSNQNQPSQNVNQSAQPNAWDQSSANSQRNWNQPLPEMYDEPMDNDARGMPMLDDEIAMQENFAQPGDRDTMQGQDMGPQFANQDENGWGWQGNDRRMPASDNNDYRNNQFRH